MTFKLMAYKIFLFLTLNYFWLLCFSNLFCASTETTESTSELVVGDWKIVEKGWPIQDYLDKVNGLKSKFYFIKHKTFNKLKWTLNATLIEKVINDSKVFKLSFKYWEYSSIELEYRPIVYIGDKQYERLHDAYKDKYTGEWMPCEYILFREDLPKFRIEIGGGNDAFAAFKDFKIEYETQSKNIPISSNEYTEYFGDLTYKDEYVTEGWSKFMPPPPINDDDGKEFIYFSENCDKSCVLKLKKLDSGAKINGTATLTFKYWIEGGDTVIAIAVPDEKPLNSTLYEWQLFNKTLWIQDFGEFNITVNTIKDEDSFVAIRNLKIEITFDSATYSCVNETKCEWETNGSYFWSKENNELKKNITYYYPISDTNSITIHRSDNMNEKNVCYSIEYWVSNDRDIKININYNIENETTFDTILKIRPNSELGSSYFCLRDLIALNAENYSISFNVEQYSYEDSVNSFVLRIDSNVTESIWNFANETQTFLRKMADNSRNKWNEEWTELSYSSKLFTFKENSVRFSAETASKIPASAHLISKWIKYDPKLHLVEPKFRINVSDSITFNAFVVRPKVCDWLSHCTDVQLNRPLDSLSRTYSFNFTQFENAEYIKLLFYFEYFQPPLTEDSYLVTFDLELLHFGDPCYKPLNCENNGTCVSNYETSSPNEPSCRCSPGNTGVLCDETDYCIKIENSPSGSEMCQDLGLECETLSNTFRCLCNANENIIWNGTKCVGLDSPDLNKWEEIINEDQYYPTGPDNSISYNFKNINTTKYDVCIKLEYKSNQTVQLKVNYNSSNEEDNELFDTSLPQAAKQESVEFCVRDFRYALHKEFQLKLRISGIKDDWNKSAFLLISFKPYVKEIVQMETYISRWDRWNNISDPNPALNQYWRFIPQQLFERSKDDTDKSISLDFKFRASLESETPSKALLISDWILNNTDFSDSENFYALKYSKDSYDKNFKLTQKVIYYENDKLESFPYSFPNNKSDDKENDYTLRKNNISIPTALNGPFKIIFEITYYLAKNQNLTELNITFEALSLGDPCFVYESGENVCQNDGTCEGSGPKQYVCNCPNTDYGGNNCELKNVCNDKNEFDENITNEKYCESLPSLPNSKETKCKVLTNHTYECICPTDDYFWEPTNKRCARNGYHKLINTCVEEECDLFDLMLNNTEISNKNIPVIRKLDDPILPFYYSTKKDAKLQLKVNNMNDDNNACFKFNYFISVNSLLSISYDNLGAINLTQTQALGDNVWFPDDVPIGEQLCVRNLTKDIDGNFSITFSAGIDNIEDEIVALRLNRNNNEPGKDYIEFKKRDKSLLTVLPYLTHWSTQENDNYSAVNQWPLKFPNHNWQLEPNNDIIDFSVNTTSIQQTSYLFSTWLEKRVNKPKLRFKISSKKFDNFVLKVHTFDDKMHPEFVQQINKSNIKDEGNVVVDISKVDTYFRIAFIVEPESQTDAEFRLESIDLGDPCVLENSTYNTCTDRGKCVRNANNTDYECKCDSKEFTGKDCQLFDYCYYRHNLTIQDEDLGTNVTGEEYCKQIGAGDCKNGGYSKFHCDCGQDKFWNFFKYNCSNNLKCVISVCDPESEQCKEPNDPSGEGICECRTGYVNISITDGLKCEKFHPCNETHREILEKKRACEDSKASCVEFGENDDDYLCVCPKGYMAIPNEDKSKISCKNIFCSFPSLNLCQQICNTDDSIKEGYNCSCEKPYKLDKGTNCVLNSDEKCNCGDDKSIFCGSGQDDCKCKEGYNATKQEDGKWKCEPYLDFPVDNICPYNNVTNTTDNKLACYCGEDFELNSETNTCEMKTVCGKGGKGRVDCDLKNAICTTNPEVFGKYTCSCPEGKRWDSGSKTCIDVCEFEGRKTKCSKIHAKCNPLKIGPSNNDTVDVFSFCDCNPGFVWPKTNPKDKCLLGSNMTQFNLSIRNIFRDDLIIKSDPIKGSIDRTYYIDSIGYANELTSAYEENFKYFNESYDRLRDLNLTNLIKYELKQILERAQYVTDINQITFKEFKSNDNGSYYNCIIALHLDKSAKNENLNGNLSTRLGEICIPVSNQPNDCYFLEESLTKLDKSESKGFSLVIDREKLSDTELEKNKNCYPGNDNCPDYKYSTCTEDESEEESLFSCICIEEYFTNVTLVYLPTEGSSNNNKAIEYTCKVKELCPGACPEANGKCSQLLPYKNESGEWNVRVECSCEFGLILSNRTCIGVCQNAKCNHGKCSPKGTNDYMCECDYGWGGIYCDDEFEPSLGGWISSVTVLAILVIVATVVAFIYARRARNKVNFDSGNNNNQEMVDYTPTSYRVGQGGQVTAHGQNPHHGNVNQGFSRD